MICKKKEEYYLVLSKKVQVGKCVEISMCKNSYTFIQFLYHLVATFSVIRFFVCLVYLYVYGHIKSLSLAIDILEIAV